jgi:methylisocitrate lyase
MARSAGLAFRSLVARAGSGPKRNPLQILGAVNPYAALLAEKAGAKALYLSGSGIATSSHGLPDLGITDLHDVLEDVRRITAASSLPLLVDIDTGFGGAFNIKRTIKELDRAGAAAVHIEDQVAAKRCGHRPNKQLVSKDEMVDRIKSAVDGRIDSKFVIMARTDALAVEGIEKAIERSVAYIEAGADMLFPEACRTLDDYKKFFDALSRLKKDVPILANITEFGETPLFSTKQLGEVGVSMVLYPLSAFRAMSKAALETYRIIISDGCQEKAIPLMQTRKELYETLDYHKYEETLDRLFGKEK